MRWIWRQARSMQPIESEWSSSISPLAIVVVANGRLWRSIRRRSSFGSERRIALEPMTAIGRLAAAISACARATASSGAAASFVGWAGAATRSFVAASATSSGRSRCTGPLGSLSASAIAWSSVSAIDPVFERQRGLGDRLEQRVVVDPHLDAPAELIGVEVAGDRDHRRAIEKGAADASREVGGAGPERRDAEPGRAGHASHNVGGEAGRAFVCGQHELDAALAHRVHQRQHVAARDAEAAGDAVRLRALRRSGRRCS